MCVCVQDVCMFFCMKGSSVGRGRQCGPHTSRESEKQGKKLGKRIAMQCAVRKAIRVHAQTHTHTYCCVVGGYYLVVFLHTLTRVCVLGHVSVVPAWMNSNGWICEHVALPPKC